MWDVARHPYDGSRRRTDGRTADRQSEDTFEHEHERIQGCGVLTELLGGIEGKEGDVPTIRFSQYTT